MSDKPRVSSPAPSPAINGDSEYSPLLSSIEPEEPSGAPPADHRSSNTALIWSFVAMILIGLGNKLFQGLSVIPMINYPLFVSLLTTAIYVPASFAYIWPMLAWGSAITPEQRAIPQKVWFIVGSLDGIAGIMQVFAATYIYNKGLLVLLLQTAIPFSMAISFVTLKTRYSAANIFGAVSVLVGLVIVLLPQFSTHPTTKQHDSPTSLMIWSAVMVLSCVPMCLSSVYKERTLAIDVDPIYFNGWVALYQFAFVAITSPLAALAANVQPKDIFSHLAMGAKCWFGVNSLKDDDCSSGPLFMNAYIAFNLGYNILIILILKYGSSNVLWLAMTVMVPMVNVAFSLKFVPHHQPMHATDIIGLVIIMLGLIVYRFVTTEKVRKMKRMLFGASVDDDTPVSTDALFFPPVQNEHLSGVLPGLGGVDGSMAGVEDTIVRHRNKHKNRRGDEETGGSYGTGR